jgi:CheY-like chemotaxis protein/HPt (histidine-containing phosphotransfer) domain-containing protein
MPMDRELIKNIISVELEKLRNILESTPEKIVEIISEFNIDTPARLSSLMAKIKHDEMFEAINLLHKIKARYSYLGFEDIYEDLDVWERQLKNGEEVPDLLSNIQRLEKDTQLIIEELNTLDIDQAYQNLSNNDLPLSGKKVLVAEDDEINAMIFEAFIEELGGEFIIAHDGFEAVKTVAEKTPDIIFMDVHMPYYSGLDAIRTLRSRGVKTPIISLSASSRLNERDESIKAGANDFITKPANKNSIKQVLLKHISQ